MSHLPSTGAPRVVIAGGGYVGLYAALRLEQLLEPGEADLYLVNPDNFMVYRPLLPEVASGTVEPRHAVVPLRKALRRTQLVTGRLSGLDADEQVALLTPRDGEEYGLAYDHLVVGLGSQTRVLDLPGLAEHAIGFQTLPEAIHLRNHVLERMEAAESSMDPVTRRRALTFVFVGGGYTGVEALAELEDMARSACRLFPSLQPADFRWVLVEMTDRILPTVSPELSRHALGVLRGRGIEVHLEQTPEAAEDGGIHLSDGTELTTDTLVWVAGVEPNALLADLGLPTDDQGRLVVDERLAVPGRPGVWGGGDCAAVPDADGDGYLPPTAQHAQREGRHIGESIAATLRDERPQPFRYASPGELITLGRNKGVGMLYGRPLRGFGVWLLRRVYYALQIPTVNRKMRILLDWAIGLPLRREVVSLGSAAEPREAFEAAARDEAA
jgi:NADH:ubiquinone reductase (H+-translocating)